MIFYEIKIAYQRQTGEDNPNKVKETYLVEGLNCSDVETRLMENIKPFIFGDCEVTSCRKVQYYDLLPAPEAGGTWYKARVELITVEDNGKETRKAVSILVEATSIDHAQKDIAHYLSTLDCELIGLTKTPIMDVLRAVN